MNVLECFDGFTAMEEDELFLVNGGSSFTLGMQGASSSTTTVSNGTNIPAKSPQEIASNRKSVAAGALTIVGIAAALAGSPVAVGIAITVGGCALTAR